MTQERTDQATPNGGDYSVAVYVDLKTFTEVDKTVASGIVITEYTAAGTFVAETVGTWTAASDAAPTETVDEKFKRLGFEWEEPTGETQVIFVGPKGAAAARKLTGQ